MDTGNIFHKVNLVVDKLQRVVDHVAGVVVMPRSAVYTQTVFKQYVQLYKSSKVPTSMLSREVVMRHLNSIVQACDQLLAICLNLTMYSWHFLTLAFPATMPFEMIPKLCEEIEQATKALGLKAPHFAFDKAEREADLTFVLGVYRCTQSQDPEVKNQIKRLEDLFRREGLAIPKDVELDASYDPVIYAKKWEIEMSDVNEDRRAVYESENATLFKTAMRSTGNPIFLFKMLPGDADEKEKEIARSQIMTLTTLVHPSIAPVLGGHVGKEICCAYEYSNDSILYSLLRHPKNLTPTDFTRIAYGIARGMNYLHSLKMVHGNLTSYSVIFNESYEPRLWNYGLSGYAVEMSIMPPEYFEMGIYTDESDVYQFGMLLWEMAKKQEPFVCEPEGALRIEVTQKGKRPDLTGIEGGLRKLIEECWAQKPVDRPTFHQVLRRFESGTVYFAGSDVHAIEAYFKNIRADRWNPENFQNPAVRQVVELFQDQSKENEQLFMLNQLAGDVASRGLVRELVDLGIIEKMSPLLNSSKGAMELGSLLIELFADPEYGRRRVSAFVETKGIASLIAMIHDKEKKPMAYQIIKVMQGQLTPDPAAQLLSTVLEDGRYDVAKVLANQAGKASLQVLGSYLSQIIASLKTPAKRNDASQLVEFYLGNISSIKEFVAQVTIEDVIKIGSVPLMRALMVHNQFLATFKNDDAISICVYIKNGSEEEKQCAMVFALSLGPEFYRVLAQYPDFIESALSVSDKRLAYRFLTRICRFPQACEYLLGKPELFEKNMTDPWILVALSRIAGFFPGEVMKMPFLKTKLVSNLDRKCQIEATLRLLGVFSTSEAFWESSDLVVKSLLKLLKSRASTPLETKILVSVLANIASFVSLKDEFLEILSLAESNGAFTGFALKAITATELPMTPGRELGRLLRLLKLTLASKDKAAVVASAAIVTRLACSNELRHSIVNSYGFDSIIVDSAMAQPDPYTFIALISALDKLEVTVTPQILSLFDQMLLKTGEELPEFVELRNRMRAKLRT